ncbi:MAG: M15 family metallopeptidase [Bacteroidales bacterium]|nr:M15 family metallopeptidase [Bacteroidales bacterium]MCF8402291.1 M15 family metallopeptidase [Bacteroidales bacterium]
MASRDLNDLTKEVKEKAIIVTEVCKEASVDILIYCTLRSLQEQARLFRQSRSISEITLKIEKFRSRGFYFLAEILEEVGPSSGPHVTNAGPGESWHNYAEAWDAVPLVNGKPAWKYTDAKEYWDAYGEAVRQVGMYWAGDWISFREYPHAQLRIGGNPLKNMAPDQIKEILTKNKLI